MNKPQAEKKAMVLAAGNSQRLRPLTDTIPKPMLPIAGRPILEHNVRLLASHGIRDLIINLHHCSDVIVNHFGDGAKFGVSIQYSWEESLLGTAGAVKKMGSEFPGSFFVIYGDNLTNCNLSRLWAHHQERRAKATIALFQRDDVTSSGIVELDDCDRVVRFLEKPRPEEVFSKWVSAGILVLEPELLERIPADRPIDFGRDFFPMLLDTEVTLSGYRMSEGLWWIDSLADYHRTKDLDARGLLPLTVT